jgi:putative ABC transport system permease protein
VGTVFTLVVAVAFLGPLLIRGAALVSAPLLRMVGVTGRLAASTTATSASRLAGVLGALVLAIGLGGSLWFMQTSAEHVAAQQFRAGLVADWVVTSSRPGLLPSIATTLRTTPGVRGATGLVRGTWLTAQDGGTGNSVEGLDIADVANTVDLDVTSGSLTALRGNAVAVDTLTAQALHLHVGSHLSGWFGDGTPEDPVVVAVYRRGLGFAPIAMSREALAAHTNSGLDDSVLISRDPTHPASISLLRRELAQLAPDARLLPRDAYRGQLDAELVQNAWLNEVVTGVLVLYAIIAALNTLVMYGLGRRREFAILSLAGTTRRQVHRMVTLEQTILLGLALVIGVAIAAATLIPMVKGTTGSSTPYIPTFGWIAVLGGVVVLGTLATAAPLRRLLRDRPVASIGLRE